MVSGVAHAVSGPFGVTESCVALVAASVCALVLLQSLASVCWFRVRCIWRALLVFYVACLLACLLAFAGLLSCFSV